MLEASWVVRLGMLALGLTVAALFAAACAQVSRRKLLPALAVALWVGLMSAASLLGVFAQWERRPPPMMIAVVLILVASVGLAFSPVGKRLATQLPLKALVGFQLFRLPLELVMFQAHAEGVMPEQMSFAGYNFDVLTGATALVLLLAGRRPLPTALVLVWNVMGSVLLLVIMGIGIASIPVFAAFGPDRLNTWVAHFPAVLLPTVLVPAALIGHLLVFRRLAAER